MRHYLTYIACTLAIVFAGSCVKIDINPVEQVPAGDLTSVTLQLKSSDLIATRASVEDDLNENLIKHVQCFFYESDTESTVVYATDVITIKDGETVGKNSEVSNLKINIPSGKMNTLFAGDNSCMVYVVANGPEEGITVKEDTTTVAQIKSTGVSLEEYEEEGEDAAAISKAKKQTSFVMDGAAQVTKSNNTIIGTVDLYRVAVKILVKLHVANKIVYDNGTEEDESDDVAWAPLLDQIRIKYVNSVTGSKLDAEPGSADLQTLSNFLQQPYADYQVYDVKTGTTPVECTQAIPFYTYPYDWNSESSKVPSISLLIPWKSNDDVTETFEYQIPINPTKTAENGTTTETKSLVRNTVYEMTVNVGILGGLTGTVELSPSYIVTDWGTGTIDAELSRPKYLIVDENYVVMNNVNSYSVPYASSDIVSAVITSISKPNYTEKAAATTSIYSDEAGAVAVTPKDDINGNKNPFTVSVDATNHSVILSHTLVNDNTSNSFDYVPYDITVRVTNQSGFSEIITIKQYPAVYVVNHLNNNGELDNINNEILDDNSYTKTSGFGFVMVNTLYADRYDYNKSGGNPWQSVEGFDRTSNNPNMYIVTTTALDASLAKKYILGDSRSETTQTATQIGFTSITDVKNKTLQKYRATKTDRDDYLSPKFRISSAYGQLGSNTLSASQAKYRCASYQEDGYPAGRWRLATYAELSYIAMLCAKGALPESLFGASDYWSATGALEIDTDNGTVSKSTSSSAYLRCVYDDWYWGNEQLKNKNEFTWGDESSTAQLNQ